MKSSELFRFEYQVNRYLKHMTNDELLERQRDIFRNTFRLTNDGELSLQPTNDAWGKMLIHLIEEYRYRGMALPDSSISSVLDIDIERCKRIGAKLSSLPYKPGSYLVKYIPSEFACDMVNYGEIRISPASSYDDSSLNSAIRDEELTRKSLSLPENLTMMVYDGKNGEPKGPITPTGYFTLRHEFRTNFYIYCLSNRLEVRLFGDFEADSCVVIHNVPLFRRRIHEAMEKQPGGWSGIDKPVTYYDPYNCQHLQMKDPPFFKVFRYAYQSEHRFTWLPDEVEANLPVLYLQLGCLKDIAELITI